MRDFVCKQHKIDVMRILYLFSYDTIEKVLLIYDFFTRVHRKVRKESRTLDSWKCPMEL